MSELLPQVYAMRSIAASILCGLLVSPALYACPIPVFRYALEFWEPDAYVVQILHRGPLSAEAKAAANLLTEYAEDEDVTVNLVVRFTDTQQTAPGDFADHGALPKPGRARLIVRRPAGGAEHAPIWSVPLTVQAVEKLVDSPARRELARQLLDGESAVWILLEGGERRADDTAAALLEEQLKRLQATLKLPEALVDQAGHPALADSKPEVRLSFSMLRVAREDAAEAFLVASLIGPPAHGGDTQAPEGRSCAGRIPALPRCAGRILALPVVVPVFGRGRALDPLAGEDINEANINRAARFLVGPCSCQAKALNPGHDLLMRTDWESELGGSLLAVVDLPPLVSLAALADAADDEAEMTPTPRTVAATAVPDNIAATSPRASGKLTRNLLIALGLVVLVVAFLAVRVARQPAKNHP